MKVTRREFLKLAGAIGASAVMMGYKSEILAIIEKAAATPGYTIAWLQGQGCTGCTMSLVQYPDIFGALGNLTVSVPFHPTIMPEAGHNAEEVLEDLEPDFLVVEGAVPIKDILGVDTHYCDVFGIPFEDLLVEVANRSEVVVAAGTCAAFGGIPAGNPNPTDARPVSEVLSRKTVINIPGCPAHPDWMVLTLVAAITEEPIVLDRLNRPIVFFGESVHEKCERLPFCKSEKFAKTFPSPEGCLFKLGCKGPVAYADCPTRLWNNETNWCVRAGAPCIACVYEDFPDKVSPFYEKLMMVLPPEPHVERHRHGKR